MNKNSLADVFEAARAAWGGNGPGSNEAHTAGILHKLRLFLRRARIDSIADLGCGTFGWLEPVTQELTGYVGYDVVPSAIAANRRKYPKLRFEVYTGGPLEPADAVLCRDVMQHLTSRQNLDLIEVVRESADWLIASTQGCVNRELAAAGGFRPVNLKLRPYQLGEPVEMLRDYSGKFLGCWDLRR